MKILIVDDTEDSREFLKTVLEFKNHLVFTAVDGLDAISQIKQETPELIISDLLMPNMDGFMFLQQIRDNALYDKIPFIVYTATYTDESDERLALELGADRFLLKPMAPARLVDEVNKIINNQNTITENRKLKNKATLASDYSSSLAKKLDKKIEELKFAQAAKDNFLTIMCHELRTPLNGIIGGADLLLLDNLSAEQKQLVEIIKNSGTQLANVLMDIFDITQLNQKKLILQIKAFSITHCLKDLEKTFTPSMKEKGLQLVFLYDDLPEWLLGDSLRISQILSNLLSNAIKFTEKGSVECRVSILSKTSQQCRLYFEVMDTGKGIALQFLTSIFESFVLEDTSTTREYGGTGLGLSITKNLVNMMGGTIKVESELGKGSRFYFELDFTRSQPDV